MIEISTENKIKGWITCTAEYRDGSQEVFFDESPNTILKTGRSALAKVLANQIGDSNSFFVSRMIFGTNGTDDGVPKYVTDGRNGLFGVTALSKPVIATIDPSTPTQVIFTSVIAFTDANSLTLNEMALQMANGDLYSMKTFADLNKTSQIQLTMNWTVSLM